MLLFLSLLALTAVSPSDQQELRLLRGGCPLFWFNFDDHCYRYVSTRLTWGDAEFHCVSQGANLVSIHSLEEDNFVRMLIKNFDPAEGLTWIGLTDAQTERRWLWSDGSKIDFTKWDRGQPDDHGNQDCGHINHGVLKKWNDISCSATYAFVCKTRPVCR